MRNLDDIKYSIRFTEEEREKYEELAKRLKRPLSLIIRDALDSVSENPSLLNPTTPTMDIDVILSMLEKSANERLDNDSKLRKDLYDQLARLNHKVNYLLKKANIPKKELKKFDGEDISGEAIFE